MKILRNILLIMVCVSLTTVFFAGISSAEKKQFRKLVKTETLQINGELGFVNKDFVSIIYVEKGMEYEMVFYLPKNLTVEHKRSLAGINPGDRISIEYSLVTEATEEGQKERRVAKKITYLGPKVSGLRSE